MSSAVIEPLEVTIFEDSSFTVMSRVKGNDGYYVNQPGMTNVTIKVFDLFAGNQVGATLTLTPDECIFNALQTNSNDPRWTKDSIGYNFRYTIPASYFAEGDRDYLVEIVFNPVVGDDFPLPPVLVHCKNLRGS